MYPRSLLPKNRAWRCACLGLLWLALLAHGLIPIGYMPSAAASGVPLWMEICHGVTTDAPVAVEGQADIPPDVPVGHMDSPCVFALCLSLSALTFPVMQWAIELSTADTTVVENQQIFRPAITLFLPLGARAPPIEGHPLFC